VFALTYEHLFASMLEMTNTRSCHTLSLGFQGVSRRQVPPVRREASQEGHRMTISVSSPVRVAVLLTTVALMVVLLLANAVAAFGGGSGGDPVGGAEHLVVTGETLWGIAAEYTPAGEDVRHTVFDIQRANGLEGSVIYPGQVLVIPAGG
jgi:LysM repeat protein